MATINLEDIKLILQKHEPPCVSIYIPVSRGAQANSNVVRFRNLLRKAEEQLVSRGYAKSPD